ncbi:MAG: UbiA family prenyltransferase [Candidatus Dojkabacteria bacterium]|nr:UbiA family prenyltransferase [Candidatus Dojkabacteria bacterium]
MNISISTNTLEYIKLMRLKHVLKNFLILAPIFFALKIFNVELLLKDLLSVTLFTMVASAVYIINDYNDMEADRLHPRKKNRPLASGKISVKKAAILMSFLLSIGLAGLALLDIKAGLFATRISTC